MEQQGDQTQWVYRFGPEGSDGHAGMKALLGGKGANLAEMSRLGLPVPPGFVISTAVCTHFYAHDRTYPPGLEAAVEAGLQEVERLLGAGFGDPENPLLVSVRSGAPVSMPGMMDTVLNLGLNDRTVEGLSRRSGDTRFAYDSYRRFIQMYSNVVLGLEHHLFEDILERYKGERGYVFDTEMTGQDWQIIVQSFKDLVQQESGTAFPEDVRVQLWGAVGAVFGSWRNNRAVTYRRLHGISESLGTAVTVQAMVFGNMGDDCATGVAFTRNPSTGENRFYGEYLVNAQGEDVVAGLRTPQSLTVAGKSPEQPDQPALEEVMPAVYRELETVRRRLEEHYRDMQDIEFTVQQGRLYILQTRNGKRTAAAALRIAVELCKDGVIDQREAVRRLEAGSLEQLLHPTLDPAAVKEVIARGLPASPGAASGIVVLDATEAEKRAERGEAVILCRTETSPEDIHGMHAARGIVTTRGGMTSHAAVVARGMGRPCVSGAGGLRIDERNQMLVAGAIRIKAGETITIDGSTGEVIRGSVATVEPVLSGDFATLMGWADASRRLRVRANAETTTDARMAREFGAEGIGLCRTEHMFFESDRIILVRQMILADSQAEREEALARLEPMQTEDFRQLFEVMAGLPVTIRLLDPPLHEFLPTTEAEMAEVARAAGTDTQRVHQRALQLRESNPMLGHRGCRLGITYPEIYEMQARAIFRAVVDVHRASGETVVPEVMIPLVATPQELQLAGAVVARAAEQIKVETGSGVTYLLGTMIELPRAALRAGDIAGQAEFFSFGTNDLTQTTLGLSRDDSGSFLPDYVRLGVLSQDPFISLDVEGVGELMALAVERGRRQRPGLKLGICGEHGGDPASIAFCESLGLDYVSCSPFRVPVARLAAAQAALNQGDSSS